MTDVENPKVPETPEKPEKADENKPVTSMNKAELMERLKELEAKNAEQEEKLKASEAAALSDHPEAPGLYSPDDPNRPVVIRLFKDDNRYKNDVYVGVNNKNWQIQRGVKINVPFYVAEVIRNSNEQDAKTMQMYEQLAKDLNPEVPALM